MATWSINRINFLLGKFENPNYLEIGIKRGTTLGEIQSNSKVGVDPRPHLLAEDLESDQCKIVKLTSDAFFSSYKGEKFHVVFLDGLHTFEQTYKDFCNAQNNLASDGYILIDDVWPQNEFGAKEIRRKTKDLEKSEKFSNHWWGDVFKMVFQIDNFHLDWRFTYLEGGNTQLLCWKTQLKRPKPIVSMTQEEVKDLTYGSWKQLCASYPKVRDLSALSEIL